MKDLSDDSINVALSNLCLKIIHFTAFRFHTRFPSDDSGCGSSIVRLHKRVLFKYYVHDLTFLEKNYLHVYQVIDYLFFIKGMSRRESNPRGLSTSRSKTYRLNQLSHLGLTWIFDKLLYSSLKLLFTYFEREDVLVVQNTISISNLALYF